MKNIREYKLAIPFFAVRDRIMAVTGLFRLKAKIKLQLHYAKLRFEDNKLKKQVADNIYALPSNLIDKQIAKGEIIVSLTSYGHRVKDALPYMLYSLLTQTEIPHKIAVYLDQDNWNNEVLPPLLKEMQRVGVDFYYCEDLRSFKKLIPALHMFPNNPIMVCDDDFYYHKRYVEWITDAYKKSDKRTVIGSMSRIPEKRNGRYIPYSQWKTDKEVPADLHMAFGSGNGTLIPSNVFDSEIMNSEAFLRLCPTADDLWLWAMMERQNINRILLSHHGYGIHRVVNRIEDWDVENADNLTLINVVHGKNDQQLENLLNHYQI